LHGSGIIDSVTKGFIAVVIELLMEVLFGFAILVLELWYPVRVLG